MFKRVDHIEIVPSNLERTLNFYTEILGFKIQGRRKMESPSSPVQETAFVELNGILIEMFSIKDPAPVSTEQWQVGYRRMALEVEDMDKLVEHLKTKGIELSMGPVAMGTTKMAELMDPDGLSIQLMQRG